MELSAVRELSNGHSNVVPINLALRFDCVAPGKKLPIGRARNLALGFGSSHPRIAVVVGDCVRAVERSAQTDPKSSH